MQTASASRISRPPSRVPRSRRHRLILAIVVLVVLASAAVRLIGLGDQRDYIFDEHYYAHDAKAILDGRIGLRAGAPSWQPGDTRSQAHPWLAQVTIAGSIALFGDGPWGWRLPAALAGIALIAFVYPLSRRLRLPPVWALIATVLAASDTMLIVESRLAVLDMFVAFWGAACVYCALRVARSRGTWLWPLLLGLSAGAAVASKWSGALAVAAAVIVLVAQRRRLPVHAGRRLVACLIALPTLVYVLAYLPYFIAGHTLGQWLQLQHHMLSFSWEVRGSSALASRPVTWIFDAYPIWYRFLLDQRGTTGILAIGNPLLWWAAAAAFVALTVQAISRRDGRLALPLLLAAMLYLPWLATSRQTYIFYMTPVVPFLAVLVAAALARGAGCLPARWAGRRARRRSTVARRVALVYVMLVVALGLAYLPFAVGHPVPFGYYHHLMWFTTWR